MTRTKNDLGVDCISRADVIRAIEDVLQSDNCDYDLRDFLDDLADIPSVTPQEPRKGHWIKHDTYYDCSLCGCVAPCTETADSFLWKLSNFCPDCGADMRGEEV